MTEAETNEQIWRDIMLIMENEYSVSDDISSDDVKKGNIIRNPNDDGEHPYVDASDFNTATVKIEDLKLAVEETNGHTTPWGQLPNLSHMLPYYKKTGYNEWMNFNLLILINNKYCIVYNIHSAYDHDNIVPDRQEIFRKKTADMILKYLFGPEGGVMRYDDMVMLELGSRDQNGFIDSRLVEQSAYQHEFPSKR